MALSPARDRYFDPVQLVQTGSAAAGLEGAVASATGEILLWGWMHDPDDAVRSLTCVIAGQPLPVEMLDRIPRPDVVEVHAAAVRSRDDALGFLALARTDEGALRRAGGRISLQFEAGDGTGASGNRLFFEPGSSFRSAIQGRLPLAVMQPRAVRRAAEALLRPEAARVLHQARRTREVRTYGPASTPGLSIVIPIAGDGSGLRETLAYLDMSPGRSAFEVVLALASDKRERSVDEAVRAARTAFRVSVVRTAEELGAGGAARLGLDACAADHVLLMSESVVPPAALPAESVLDDLRSARFAAPRALPRFDGPTHRFDPRALVPGATAWPHDELAAALHAAAGRSGLDAWSPGLIGGRTEALLDMHFAWSAPLTDAGFWAALLAGCIRAGAAELTAGGEFTFAPAAGPASETSEGDRLLDGYGLEALLSAADAVAPPLRQDLNAA